MKTFFAAIIALTLFSPLLADEAADRAKLEEQMKREADMKRAAEMKEREKMGDKIVDPASGKVIADLAAMEKQAQEYEAAGNREAAAKVRAQIEEYRKRFAVTGGAAQPPTGADPKMLAQLKELLERAAEAEAAGRTGEAEKLRQSIQKLQMAIKAGGGAPAAAIVDASSELRLTAAAPPRVAAGQPVKITVTLAVSPSGPASVVLPALGADCLTDKANPRISFEIWHADGKPVRRLAPASQPAESVAPPAKVPSPPPVAPLVRERAEESKVDRVSPGPAATQPEVPAALKKGQKLTLTDSPFLPALSEIYAFDRPGAYTFQVRYDYAPDAASPIRKQYHLITDPVTVQVAGPPAK